MPTLIRIKVECYDDETGTIIADSIINDSKVFKPVDMIDLGYKHAEQIEILRLLQDFKLSCQTPLLNDNIYCPKCGTKSRKFGIRESQFNAVLTDHIVGIQRKKCEKCMWVSEASIDAIYGTTVHPDLLKKQAYQGAENSYRKSQTNLNAESNKKRSINNTERLRRTVDKIASVIEVEKTKNLDEPKVKDSAKELIAVVDGGHIKSNIKDSRSFEAMIASVYRPENLIAIDKHHNKITTKTSVASALSDSQVTIKKLILNACLQEGMNSKITKLTCLTDGANNCWSITKTLSSHCKDIEEILDWFHITKRFTIINNSIEPALLKKLEKVKWHLWHGNHAASLIKIKELERETSTDKVNTLLNDLYDYIERNIKYLTNYQTKSSKGLPYTSTYAEVSVNSIINVRQKCNQKMQWGREGAHKILQLRTSIFSKTWDADFDIAKKNIYKMAA